MSISTKKPGVCFLLGHLARRLFFTEKYRFYTLVGLLVVLLNVPLGWGGAAFFSLMALYYEKPFFYKIAGVCYAISWIMLGAGIVMAGRDTVRVFRARIPRAWRAWIRLRKARSHPVGQGDF